MGCKGSKPSTRYPHPPPHQSQYPQCHHQTSSPSAANGYGVQRYSRIADNYYTLDQVTCALAEAGLESSKLLIGIDFTKSNEWTGRWSFHHRSLHHLGNSQNPYEQAISIIGRTLSAFDEDNLIPCYGFGDATTHDHDVFSFYPDGRVCNGFEQVLTRYKEIVPQLTLSGPTSFAPVIERAITIVKQSGGQYHVLLIITDGQVTRSIDTRAGNLSQQEKRTIDAIVQASQYPLSIVLVGVGDGPWVMMREFDDNIPSRTFDNFQFVNFTEIMSKNENPTRKETQFALSALMEIPSQYQATLELGLLGHWRGTASNRAPLPPPISGASNFGNSSKHSRPSSFQQKPVFSAPFSSSFQENRVCPICLAHAKDMAFGCGHQTCCGCGEVLESCPICRTLVKTRIRLF